MAKSQAPESDDCIVHAPFVATPNISQRRLTAGLEMVYSAEPFYTMLEQQRRNELTTSATHGADDVIDVEVEVKEVRAPETDAALPSPAPPENLTEDQWWKRWTKMGRGN